MHIAMLASGLDLVSLTTHPPTIRPTASAPTTSAERGMDTSVSVKAGARKADVFDQRDRADEDFMASSFK